MQVNPGRTGAKRQSWSASNPRDLIKDVVRSNPRASEAEIRDEVWQIVRSKKEYLETMFDYWFANNYRSFFIEEISGVPVVITLARNNNNQQKRQSNQVTREEIEAAKEEMRPLLMDYILANGKQLRDATFKDCEKESGWLKEVSKHGKPTEVVGKHLTEKNLYNLRKRIFE